jgi:opacity protein-like surface antigen
MGFNFSYRRDVPVIPGLGVRWGFAKDWTLLLVYPVPRVEYAVTPDLTTYAGVRLIRSNYRVSETFGDQVGVPQLNNADVSYNDWRVGAGLRYRFSRLFNLTAEGGWMVGRDFEYRDEDVTVRGNGAPYVALQLTGAY